MDNGKANESSTYFWKWVRLKSPHLTIFGLSQVGLFLVLYSMAREHIQNTPAARLRQVEVEGGSRLAGPATAENTPRFFHSFNGTSLTPVFSPAWHVKNRANEAGDGSGVAASGSPSLAPLGLNAPDEQNQDLAEPSDAFPAAWSGDMEEMDLGDDQANSPGLLDDPAQASSMLYVAPNPAQILLKAVPEPDPLALALMGGAMAGWRRWRARKKPMA